MTAPKYTTIPDLTSQFENDFDEAQKKYQQYSDAGFSNEDAAQTFFNPLLQKWKIISTSPKLTSDKSAFDKFNEEFNNSNSEFQKLYNQYNRDGGDWAASRTLQPLLLKWSILSHLPVESEKPLSASEATSASNLPSRVLREAEQGNVIPTDSETSKPFKLTIPQDLSEKLTQADIDLQKSGMDAATAMQEAKRQVLGNRWSIAPNLVTNSPAIPEVPKSRFLGVPVPFTGSAAVPADVSTNYFKIQPEQVDAAQPTAPVAQTDKFSVNPAVAQAQAQLPDFGVVKPKQKQAIGGYKIGSKYAGLTYLGGDPKDENNWQKSYETSQ